MRILLDFSPDVDHKSSRFSKTLLEKDLKFVENKKNSIAVFNLSLLLLPTKVDFILVEQSYKKNMLRACATSGVKMVLALSTKVVRLYMRATII